MLGDSMLTVITPAATYDLTTLETVKDELSITGNDVDIRLARWIKETSGYIARWCNRVFGLEQVSEQWRAVDRWSVPDSSAAPRPLLLTRFPVVSIDSITDQDGTVLPVAEYEFDENTGRLWRLTDSGGRNHWWSWRLAVAYSGGYDLPDGAPDELQQACLMLMKIRNDTQSRDRMQRSLTVPGVLEEEWWNPATPGQPGMPPEIAEVLTAFRDHNA
jgi:hypothetical protein